MNRQLEPYTVETVQRIGDSTALISTNGVLICRHNDDISWTPEPGTQLLLETLPNSCRVTGLGDGQNSWSVRYTDAEIAEQDRRAHEDAIKAQEAAAGAVAE